MKNIFLFLSLTAGSAYAVGSHRTLSSQEISMADALLSHQPQIAAALKKAGVQGEIKITQGAAFEGGMPSFQTHGYKLTVSQCHDSSPANPCQAIGTLTIAYSISSENESESVSVKFDAAH